MAVNFFEEPIKMAGIGSLQGMCQTTILSKKTDKM
jgi:hypothetical protein